MILLSVRSCICASSRSVPTPESESRPESEEFVLPLSLLMVPARLRLVRGGMGRDKAPERALAALCGDLRGVPLDGGPAMTTVGASFVSFASLNFARPSLDARGREEEDKAVLMRGIEEREEEAIGPPLRRSAAGVGASTRKTGMGGLRFLLPPLAMSNRSRNDWISASALASTLCSRSCSHGDGDAA